MINFNKNSIFNLKQINVSDVRNEISSFLIDGEEIIEAFKTIRDQVIFTNKRIISVDVQGITGKRKSFSTLPYSTIQFFEIQTQGFMEILLIIIIFDTNIIRKNEKTMRKNYLIIMENKSPVSGCAT